MSRRLSSTRKLHPGSLLIAVLGFMMLAATAISSGNQAAAPVLPITEASGGATQVAHTILPKADRDQRVRLQITPSDGDDTPPAVFAVFEGYAFPVAAQESLPDPPVGLSTAHCLSTRFSAPRAPPVSA